MPAKIFISHSSNDDAQAAEDRDAVYAGLYSRAFQGKLQADKEVLTLPELLLTARRTTSPG